MLYLIKRRVGGRRGQWRAAHYESRSRLLGPRPPSVATGLGAPG